MSVHHRLFSDYRGAICSCDLCHDDIAMTTNRDFLQPKPPPCRKFMGLDVCDECCRELIRCGVTIPMPEILTPI